MHKMPDLRIDTGVNWEDEEREGGDMIAWPISGERLGWKVRLDEVEFRVVVARRRYLSYACYMEDVDKEAEKRRAYLDWQKVLLERESLLEVIPGEFLGAFPESPSVYCVNEPIDFESDLSNVFWGVGEFCGEGTDDPSKVEVNCDEYRAKLACLRDRHEKWSVEEYLRIAIEEGRVSEEGVIGEAMRLSGLKNGDGDGEMRLRKRLREALVEPRRRSEVRCAKRCTRSGGK